MLPLVRTFCVCKCGQAGPGQVPQEAEPLTGD